MLAAWIVCILALCACGTHAYDKDFHVYRALRKSNFTVNLRKKLYDCIDYRGEEQPSSFFRVPVSLFALR